VVKKLVLYLCLLVSNILYAQEVVITSVGKYTDLVDNSIEFLLFKGGIYGDGMASIYMRDKYGLDTVSLIIELDTTMIEIMGYMKKLTLALNPAVNIDGEAIQVGRQQCIDNPASCGIELADSNGSTQAGIDQCKTDPASCGIIVSDSAITASGDCIANYSLAGQLHVPCVSVPDAFGGTAIYDIKMNQQTGSFTFDLDMGSVKPK